jgi:predicted transcriptional regulator
MPRISADVTDAELAVLQLMWDGGPATVRHLSDTLYPEGGASGYATVQKLLGRMESKGFVARKREGNGQRFEPLVGREELIGRRLRAVAETLCGGSLVPILSHLVSAERLSESERTTLRRLIDGIESDPPATRGRSSGR